MGTFGIVSRRCCVVRNIKTTPRHALTDRPEFILTAEEVAHCNVAQHFADFRQDCLVDAALTGAASIGHDVIENVNME